MKVNPRGSVSGDAIARKERRERKERKDKNSLISSDFVGS